MSNKQANSIGYYTVDVGIMDDSKIQKVIARHTWKEVSSFLSWILPLIYGEEGYFYQWDEDSSSLYALKSASDKEIGETILMSLIEKGFFNKRIFEEYKVVTSSSVQRRYSIAISRRKQVEVIKEYWIYEKPENIKLISLNGQDVNAMYTSSTHDVDIAHTSSEHHLSSDEEMYTSNIHNERSSGIDVDNFSQSKVKESKVKESNLTESENVTLKFSDYFFQYPKENQIGEVEAKNYWDRIPTEDEKQKAIDLVQTYIDEAKVQNGVKRIHPVEYLMTKKYNYLGQISEQYDKLKQSEKEVEEKKTDGTYVLQKPKEAKLIIDYINENLPKVSSMKYQMNLAGADKLCYDYGYEKVIEKLIAMENWERIETRQSVVTTCRHWLVNEYGVLEGGKNPKKIIEMQTLMSKV